MMFQNWDKVKYPIPCMVSLRAKYIYMYGMVNIPYTCTGFECLYLLVQAGIYEPSNKAALHQQVTFQHLLKTTEQRPKPGYLLYIGGLYYPIK